MASTIKLLLDCIQHGQLRNSQSLYAKFIGTRFFNLYFAHFALHQNDLKSNSNSTKRLAKPFIYDRRPRGLISKNTSTITTSTFNGTIDRIERIKPSSIIKLIIRLLCGITAQLRYLRKKCSRGQILAVDGVGEPLEELLLRRWWKWSLVPTVTYTYLIAKAFKQKGSPLDVRNMYL